MEEKIKVRIIHAMIQLSPYYLYMCILMFVLSNSISIYILYSLMHIFSLFLFISFIFIETIFACFNEGQSLSEYLTNTYFPMKNDNLAKQLFRHAILEGLIPLLLTLVFHVFGYILFLVIDEGTRLLNSKRRSLIEMVMDGEIVKEFEQDQPVLNEQHI